MLDLATSRLLHSSPVPVATLWVWPLPRLDGAKPMRTRTEADHVELGYASTPARAIPVLAAHDGIVTYADPSTVCLDHAGGFSTQYGNLSSTRVLRTDRFRRRRKERVRAGDVLGFAGNSLRFTLAQLSKEQDALVPIDPAERMRRWQVLNT